MCGRFSITKEEKQIEDRFGATFYSEQLVRWYNAAPTQMLPAIIIEDPSHVILMRWGLIPYWARDIKIGYRMINARSEGILDSKVFRKPLERKRCLVPADGFYEWLKSGKTKKPIRFVMKDESLFSFAGIYDTWVNAQNETIRSFSIITTEPNDLVLPVHNRMPAILKPDEEGLWLDPSIGAEEIHEFLKPYPPDRMNAYEVSTLVNSPFNNTEEVIQKVA